MSPTPQGAIAPFQHHASALVARGYHIIPIPRGSKRPALTGWQDLVATPEMVRQWGANGYADGNIGVLTQHTPAVDLDILDATFAREMELFVTDLLGGGLVRVGRAPKRLIVFRTEAPFTKRSSPFFIDDAGQKHRVEILATGQQFVAYGTHPDTGKPYEWISFEGEPIDFDPVALPAITVNQADQIVADFCRRAQARGWTQQGHGSVGQGHEADDNPFFHQRPVVDLTIEQIEAHLADMPDAEVYDTWVRVGAALHHQFGGSDEGKELWDTWSAMAANYDADAIDEKWASFGHYVGTPITFAYVLKFAKEAREQREAAEHKQTYDAFVAEISACGEFTALLHGIAPKIRNSDLDAAHRDALATRIQARAKKLGDGIALKRARVAVTPPPDPTPTVSSKKDLELALAHRVLERCYANGDHLCRFATFWWAYVLGVWKRQDEEVVARHILETLVELREADDPELQTLYARMDDSRGDRTNQLVSTLSTCIARILASNSDDDPLNLRAFKAPRVMNCLNGELWFDSVGEIAFSDHNPAHRLTAQLKCAYDPTATCPTWDAGIRKVFQECQDPEAVIRHFYEVFGYILQSTRDAAIWVLFKGPGGNGKTFLLNIIAELMGRTVIGKSIHEIVKLNNTHFTAALMGKLMLLDDDLKTGIVLPDDWLKKLSEDKLLTTDPKYGQHVEIVSRAVPVILTNSWPSMVDMTEGLRRRLLVFEATHILTDAEKDPAHRENIREQELPGVLNHLVAGFQRFLRRGGRFDPPAECLASKERCLAESNPTMRFVNEIVEKTGNTSDFVKLSDLYVVYEMWMLQQERNSTQLGKQNFRKAMVALGFHYRQRSYWGFSGIRLRPLEDTGFAEVEDDGLSEGLLEEFSRH